MSTSGKKETLSSADEAKIIVGSGQVNISKGSSVLDGKFVKNKRKCLKSHDNIDPLQAGSSRMPRYTPTESPTLD